MTLLSKDNPHYKFSQIDEISDCNSWEKSCWDCKFNSDCDSLSSVCLREVRTCIFSFFSIESQVHMHVLFHKQIPLRLHHLRSYSLHSCNQFGFVQQDRSTYSTHTQQQIKEPKKAQSKPALGFFYDFQ